MKDVVISKSLLIHQYETMKVSDIAKYYGICFDRLYSILDEAGIDRKVIRSPRREKTNTILKD